MLRTHYGFLTEDIKSVLQNSLSGKFVTQYNDKEAQAQKWRRLTPLGLVANLASSFFGMGLVAYFGNYYIQSEDKKFDIIFQQMKEYHDVESSDFQKLTVAETNDIKCLTKEVFQCCGNKINVTC